MKELKLWVDENCERCQEALNYFNSLYGKHEGAYGGSRKVDDVHWEKIRGVVLRPDYNSDGYLTHFHLDIEKEE